MPVTNTQFNPSGNPEIAAIKAKANELAAIIEDLDPSWRRLEALKHLETASMWAVKAAAVGDAE